MITTYARAAGDTAFATQVLEVMREITVDYIGNRGLEDYLKKKLGDVATVPQIFEFLKGKIFYLPDAPGIEEIRSPLKTIIDNTGGDCDDMSVAAATVLKMYGYAAKFRAVQWRTDKYTHVYVVTIIGGVEVPFDLTQHKLGEEYIFTKGLELVV